VPLANTVPEEVNSVIVRNVAPTVDPPTHKVLADFFSFCGNISALTIAPDSRDPTNTAVMAVVTFESKAAARTAVLLNNALINERAIQVELAPPNFRLVTDASSPQTAVRNVPYTDLPQRNLSGDGTQTSVIVGLLAKGYSLSGTAMASARKFDEENSISKKAAEIADSAAQGVRNIDAQLGVSATLSNIGTSVQQKAQELGQNYQVTEKAQAAGQVLDQWGHAIGDGIQNAAKKTTDFVHATPVLQTAADTVTGWGQAIAGVFTDAKALAAQEQAELQGNAIPVPPPAPMPTPASAAPKLG